MRRLVALARCGSENMIVNLPYSKINLQVVSNSDLDENKAYSVLATGNGEFYTISEQFKNVEEANQKLINITNGLVCRERERVFIDDDVIMESKAFRKEAAINQIVSKVYEKPGTEE